MGTTGSVDGVERVQIAAEVYIYGYPLVYNLQEIDGFANNIASIPFSAPYNEFGHARELLGPETEFVSPNNDTLWRRVMCAGDRSCCTCRTRAAGTTCFSS